MAVYENAMKELNLLRQALQSDPAALALVVLFNKCPNIFNFTKRYEIFYTE